MTDDTSPIPLEFRPPHDRRLYLKGVLAGLQYAINILESVNDDLALERLKAAYTLQKDILEGYAVVLDFDNAQMAIGPERKEDP